MRRPLVFIVGGMLSLAGSFGAQAEMYHVYADAPDGAEPPGLYDWGFKVLPDAWAHAVANPGDHVITLDTLESGSTQNLVSAPLELGDNGNITITTLDDILPEIRATGDFPVFRNLSATGKILVVEGFSPGQRLLLYTEGGAPLLDCGSTPSGDGVIMLQNVVLRKKQHIDSPNEDGAPNGYFMRLDNDAADAHRLTNVRFAGGDRALQTMALLRVGSASNAGPAEIWLDSVDFSGGEGAAPRLEIVNLARVSAESCVFRPARTHSESMSARAVTTATTLSDGGIVAVFVGCDFESGMAKLFSNLGNGTHVTANRFALYSPDFKGACGDSASNAAFHIADSGARVEILGLSPGADLFDAGDDAVVAGQYADMDGLTADTGCHALLRSGSMRFDHVKGAIKPSFDAALTSYGGVLTGDVTIEMDSCDWANGAGTYICRATGGAFAPKIRVKNTMYRGGGVACYLNAAGYNGTQYHTGTGEIFLEHVTLTDSAFSPVSEMLVKGKTGDTLYCAAALFDAPVASNLAPVWKSGYEWTNLAWNRQDAEGRGGFSPDPSVGFVFADPKIDSLTGKLTTGSGALGIAGALDATNKDFEGDSRPLPVGFGTPDIGADEAEFGPTDIVMTPDPGAIGDDASVDDLVAVLSIVDPDPGDTGTFLILNDAGGRFKIAGNQVLVADDTLLDAGVQSSHVISVRAKDSTLKSVDKDLTVNILDRKRPVVAEVAVTETLTVEVTFSEPMLTSEMIEAGHYLLSGSGRGTLSDHPAAVTVLSSTKVQLVWTSGEMRNGGDITITVSGVHDAEGNLITLPDSGTHLSGGAGGVPPWFYGIAVQSDTRIDVYFSEAMLESGPANVLDTANYQWWIEGSGPPGTAPLAVQSIPATPGGYTMTLAGGSISENQTVYVSVGGGADLAGNPIDPNDPGCPAAPNCLQASFEFTGAAPSVSGLTADSEHSLVISFNEPMGTGDSTPANYTLSGAGVGTLSVHPDQVVRLSGTQNRYRLIWNTGEMLMGPGLKVYVTVTDVYDAAGILIDEDGDYVGCLSLAVPPVVSEVRVVDKRTMKVIFSESMSAANLDLPGRYVLSGPGKGTLSANPASVELADAQTCVLRWNTGGLEPVLDVTVTVLIAQDLAGNPLGTPESGTAANRIRITSAPSGAKRYVSTPLSLTITAAGVGPFHYEWRKEGAKLGEDAPVLNFSSLTFGDAGDYVCLVSDSRDEKVTTAPIRVEVYEAFRFVTHPLPSVTVPQGGTLHLSAAIAGGIPPFNHQWKRGSVNVGIDDLELSIPSMGTADAGTYHVEVTDQIDTYVSGSSAVTVDVNVPLGGWAVLALLVSGLSAAGYRMTRRRS